MATFNNGSHIGNYTIQSLIKANLYTETYRVEDLSLQPFFMKVYVMKRVPEKLVNADSGVVLEIEYCQKLQHRNLASFITSGKMESEIEGECQYYVTNYFSGELLAEKVAREGKMTSEQALKIFRGILEGLQYMHQHGLYHNDITPRNIMLPNTTNGIPEIIDLGHVSTKCSGKVQFDTSDLEVRYAANETFAGLYDEQSDIFSATAVLYFMLTGEAPWQMNLDANLKHSRKAFLLKEYRKATPLDFASMPADDRTKAILAKGLAVAYADRYKNIENIVYKDMLHEVLNEVNKEQVYQDVLNFLKK